MIVNEPTEKICSGCEITKPLSEFAPNPNGKYGRHSRCKSCQNTKQKEDRVSSPERMRGYGKKYKAANPDKVKAASKAYYERNSLKLGKQRRDRYQNNKNYELARNKRWQEANQERVREYDRISRARKRSTPKGKLENSMKAGVHRGITKGSKASRKTFSILGYSLNKLMRHLERKFLPGMSWENYGDWHVDHKVPLAVHNYNSPDDIDFKRAWALNNLQPLWAKDNMRKNDKLDREFQPSLAMSLPANDNNKI